MIEKNMLFDITKPKDDYNIIENSSFIHVEINDDV